MSIGALPSRNNTLRIA